MQQMLEWAGQWSQWAYIGIVIVCVLVLNRLVYWVLRAIAKRSPPEQKAWRHGFVTALDAPIRCLIWLLGVHVCLTHYVTDRPDIVTKGFHILVTLAIAWFFSRAVKRIKANHVTRAKAQGSEVDYTSLDAYGKVTWALIIVFVALDVLKIVGVPLSGLLAFGGTAGIAVGFAAQNLVSNIFGGLTVFSSHIFKIGEDIVMPGTDLAGTVENIGWRSTRVLGWNGKPFFIPNSVFNTSTVINHSRMVHRTISEDVLLRYEDFEKVEEIVREGNQMLEQREDIGYYVFRFGSFGDKALKLTVYAYAQTSAYAEFMRIKEDVLMKIANIVRNKGCTLVLPLGYYVREESAHGLSAAAEGIGSEHRKPSGA